MVQIHVIDDSNHNKNLDIYKKLDKPLEVNVPTKLEFEYEKKIFDFFMKYGKKEYVSHHQLYEEVFPERGDDDSRMISITLSNFRDKGILSQRATITSGRSHRFRVVVVL